MLPQTPIANGAHDSPARLLFVERALECQRAGAVPHGGVHGPGATELGKIAGQVVVNAGIGLKCENISLRPNAMCGKYSVKTNVRAHVEINIAGLEQHVEARAHVRFIHTGPHSYGVRDAALPRNRMTPEPHGSDPVRSSFHQRCTHPSINLGLIHSAGARSFGQREQGSPSNRAAWTNAFWNTNAGAGKRAAAEARESAQGRTLETACDATSLRGRQFRKRFARPQMFAENSRRQGPNACVRFPLGFRKTFGRSRPARRRIPAAWGANRAREFQGPSSCGAFWPVRTAETETDFPHESRNRKAPR